MKKTLGAICMGMIMATAGIGASEAHAAVPPAPSDKVTVERVTFKNRINIDVAGDLYLPKNINRTQKHRGRRQGTDFRLARPEACGNGVYHSGLRRLILRR